MPLAKTALLLYLVSVFCLTGGTFAADSRSESVDVKQLYYSTEALVRSLNSCHAVVAQRGGNTPTSLGVPSKEVVYCEFWIVGDSVQCRERYLPKESANDPWWTGFSSSRLPVSKKTLIESIPTGEVFRFRHSTDEKKRFTYTPATNAEPYPGVYELNRKKEAVSGGFLPLIGMNRKWTMQGTLLDTVMRDTKVEDWEIEGEDRILKKPAIRVKAKRPSSGTHATSKGDLDVTMVYHIWFSTEDRYAPMRIEQSVEYTFDGKTYPYQREPGQRQYLASYQATDFKEYSGDIFYPQSGREETFMPHVIRAASTGIESAANKIVSQILSTGAFLDRTPQYAHSKREWRILELEYLDPETELFIAPPVDVLVLDKKTGHFVIQDKTDEESRKILGLLPIDGTVLSDSPISMARRIIIVVNVIVVAVLAVWIIRKRRNQTNG